MSAAATKTRGDGFAGRCLASRRWQPPAPGALPVMPPAAAQALADLMPLLLCGEESAEFVFAGAAHDLPAHVDPALRLALEHIADDERRHGTYLSALRSRLPPPADASATRRATRLLRRLATDNLGLHLARVAALDACFCHVLAEVCRPGTQIAAAPEVAQIFARIRKDEGRHVRISRRCAAALGVSAETELSERHLVLGEFAELLARYSPAFAAVGVDMARLLRRLGKIGHRDQAPGRGPEAQGSR